jgi:chromosome partitioning protein
MRTIAMLKQKGGAGATTIAVHTALAAAKAGRRVVLIDTDIQQTAFAWSRARDMADPPVVVAEASELPAVLQAARDDGYTLAIIDTPPHAKADTAMAARVADLAILPTRPLPFDLAAFPATLAIAQATKTAVVGVLSICPPAAPEIAEARDYVESLGVDVWPGQITERRIFWRILATGATVIETQTQATEAAALEITALWRYIASKLA